MRHRACHLYELKEEEEERVVYLLPGRHSTLVIDLFPVRTAEISTEW